MRRSSLALLAALALSALTLTCRDAPAATPTPAAPSPAASATGAPATATATAAASAAAEQVASTAAVPTDELPRVVFERADGSSVALPVEVPPRAEYSIGLSGRRELAGRGMLFYYPGGAGNAGFWMQNTHVDLAIAFVGVDGVVGEIHEMAAESLEITRPGDPYEYAIEAPAGWYTVHGVSPGDRVRLDFDVTDFVR